MPAEINAGKLEALLLAPEGMAWKKVIDLGRKVTNRAKVLAPVDTGTLRNSIASDPVPKREGTRLTINVQATANYAYHVNNGTTPHVIRPKNKKALRFSVGGKIVFSKWARHPGSKARPFMTNALKEEGAKAGFNVEIQ